MWTNQIDKSYVLNLPERRDRYWISTWEIARYQIPVEYVRAVKHPDGREGLYQTMRGVFLKALQAGYQRVLIFEDDLKFLRDPGPVMDKSLAQLPADFDLLYLGCNLAERPKGFYSDNLIPVTRALSTHAVVYSRQCMEQFVSLPRILPIDVFLTQCIQTRGKSYCCCPFIVTQYPSYSDIEHSSIDWSSVLQERFDQRISELLTQPICCHENSQCCRA